MPHGHSWLIWSNQPYTFINPRVLRTERPFRSFFSTPHPAGSGDSGHRQVRAAVPLPKRDRSTWLEVKRSPQSSGRRRGYWEALESHSKMSSQEPRKQNKSKQNKQTQTQTGGGKKKTETDKQGSTNKGAQFWTAVGVREKTTPNRAPEGETSQTQPFPQKVSNSETTAREDRKMTANSISPLEEGCSAKKSLFSGYGTQSERTCHALQLFELQ